MNFKLFREKKLEPEFFHLADADAEVPTNLALGDWRIIIWSIDIFQA